MHSCACPFPAPLRTRPRPKSGEERPVYRLAALTRPVEPTGVKKALFFGGSTPFLWASTKEMVSNRRTGHRPPPNVSAHTQKPADPHQPPPQVGRGTSRPPTCSAHADGGANRVKKRFSLAARHRFFGQAPKKWGRKAGQANAPLPTYRRTRTSAGKEGGTPGEDSPLNPLLR